VEGCGITKAYFKPSFFARQNDPLKAKASHVLEPHAWYVYVHVYAYTHSQDNQSHPPKNA